MNPQETPSPPQINQNQTPENVSHLVQSFASLRYKTNLDQDGPEQIDNAYEELVNALESSGFELGQPNTTSSIFNNPLLICRSEHFNRVINLVLNKRDIQIKKSDQSDEANMCHMRSGDGFRIAMQEGFSGKDVNGVIKTVMTFKPSHLTKQENVKSNSSLYTTKPETAKVSLLGEGLVIPDDIEMISFRLPKDRFPEHLLTEREQDKDVAFIVRHYIKK